MFSVNYNFEFTMENFSLQDAIIVNITENDINYGINL